jgi:hypothetical protein
LSKKPLIVFSGGYAERRKLRQAVMILSLLLLLLTLSACDPQKGTTPTAVEITDDVINPDDGKKNEECPQLDSKLYELYLLEDPTSRAEQLGFRVEDGKVFVILVLADEETEVPEGFDLDVGTRVGDQVQVFMPFDELCDLANTEEVIAILQPIEPVLE